MIRHVLFVQLIIMSSLFSAETSAALTSSDDLVACTDQALFATVQKIIDHNYEICNTAQKNGWIDKNYSFNTSADTTSKYFMWANQSQYEPLKDGLMLSVCGEDINMYTPWGSIWLLHRFSPYVDMGITNENDEFNKNQLLRHLKTAVLVSSLSKSLNLRLYSNNSAYNCDYWKEKFAACWIDSRGNKRDVQYKRETLYQLKQEITVDTKAPHVDTIDTYLEKSSLDSLKDHAGSNAVFVSSGELLYEVLEFNNKPIPAMQLQDLQRDKIRQLWCESVVDGIQIKPIDPELDRLFERNNRLFNDAIKIYSDFKDQYHTN